MADIRDPRHVRGESAERLAERHLVGRGLKLVARNFRCRAGELDLILIDRAPLIDAAAGIDRAALVVVEVRQRTERRVAGPLESVGGAKRRRIRRATEFFRLGYPQWRGLAVRFDVVAVHGAPDHDDAIEWVKNAFT